MSENEIATVVVDKAFKIHKPFGPGLFESVYETVVEYELKKVFRDGKTAVPDSINSRRPECSGSV